MNGTKTKLLPALGRAKAVQLHAIQEGFHLPDTLKYELLSTQKHVSFVIIDCRINVN